MEFCAGSSDERTFVDRDSLLLTEVNQQHLKNILHTSDSAIMVVDLMRSLLHGIRAQINICSILKKK